MNKFDVMVKLMVNAHLLRTEQNVYRQKFYDYYLTRRLKCVKLPYNEAELVDDLDEDYINAI